MNNLLPYPRTDWRSSTWPYQPPVNTLKDKLPGRPLIARDAEKLA